MDINSLNEDYLAQLNELGVFHELVTSRCSQLISIGIPKGIIEGELHTLIDKLKTL